MSNQRTKKIRKKKRLKGMRANNYHRLPNWVSRYYRPRKNRYNICPLCGYDLTTTGQCICCGFDREGDTWLR